MRVDVIWGQDTPAYAEQTIEVPDDLDDAAIIEAVKAAAAGADELEFDEARDWTGLRAVEVRIRGGRVVAEGVPICPSHEDLGIVAANFLSGASGALSLVLEAQRQGFPVAPKVEDLLAPAQMVVPDFEPFQLVVEAFTTSDHGEAPSALALEVSPEWARDKAIKAARLGGLDCWSGTFANVCGRWIGGEALRLGAADFVICPALPQGGAVPDAEFWFSTTPKHADYEVQTRPVALSDLIDRAISPRVNAIGDGLASLDWVWCASGKTLVVAEGLDVAQEIVEAL